MIKLNLTDLRPQLDLEGKYVDFSLLRAALTVEKVVGDLDINLSKPNEEGESRATCPKCRIDRSFALNINTNRFNCFAKGCILKGGGVIDLFAKLYEVPAKEASHLLACAYGIQPYTSAEVEAVAVSQMVKLPATNNAPAVSQAIKPSQPNEKREVVSRAEFEALQSKVERLSIIVWSLIFEQGEIDEDAPDIFDEESDYELETAMSV
jgi:hypothetical protein